jgi:hypothetical protein
MCGAMVVRSEPESLFNSVLPYYARICPLVTQQLLRFAFFAGRFAAFGRPVLFVIWGALPFRIGS